MKHWYCVNVTLIGCASRPDLACVTTLAIAIFSRSVPRLVKSWPCLIISPFERRGSYISEHKSKHLTLVKQAFASDCGQIFVFYIHKHVLAF